MADIYEGGHVVHWKKILAVNVYTAFCADGFYSHDRKHWTHITLKIQLE